jgi:hypothetical protein
VTTKVDNAVVARRGRPRKFTGPSRGVTLTLPEHVIDALAAIDADLSRAIVRLVQPELAKRPHSTAELAPFGRSAVIVVQPSPTLERRIGVLLVPLPDGRALISFDEPKTIPEIELQLQDLLEDPELAGPDKQTFAAVLGFLRDARRSSAVTLRRRSIIVLERSGPPRRRASDARARKTPPRISRQ